MKDESGIPEWNGLERLVNLSTLDIGLEPERIAHVVAQILRLVQVVGLLHVRIVVNGDRVVLGRRFQLFSVFIIFIFLIVHIV